MLNVTLVVPKNTSPGPVYSASPLCYPQHTSHLLPSCNGPWTHLWCYHVTTKSLEHTSCGEPKNTLTCAAMLQVLWAPQLTPTVCVCRSPWPWRPQGRRGYSWSAWSGGSPRHPWTGWSARHQRWSWSVMLEWVLWCMTGWMGSVMHNWMNGFYGDGWDKWVVIWSWMKRFDGWLNDCFCGWYGE